MKYEILETIILTGVSTILLFLCVAGLAGIKYGFKHLVNKLRGPAFNEELKKKELERKEIERKARLYDDMYKDI